MTTIMNQQRLKESYPDDGLRDYVRTKAVKAAAKKHVYYSTLFRDNNITDYSQYRPIDITRKIKELWDVKGEDYVPVASNSGQGFGANIKMVSYLVLYW